MDRKLAHPLLVLQAQPGSLGNLSANGLNDLPVRLRPVLQLVESGLQLQRQLFGQVVTPCRDARGLQIGDRSNLIPFSLERHLRQVPPRTLLLLEFVLLIRGLLGVAKAVANEARELVAFDRTNPVEVIVPAVALGRLRMKGEGCFEAQLPLDDRVEYFRLAHSATCPPQLRHQQRECFPRPEAEQRQEVVFPPNRVPHDQEVAAGKIRNGRFLWHPVRTAVDFSFVAEQEPVVRQGERREGEATRRAHLKCPVRQAACEL